MLRETLINTLGQWLRHVGTFFAMCVSQNTSASKSFARYVVGYWISVETAEVGEAGMDYTVALITPLAT